MNSKPLRLALLTCASLICGSASAQDAAETDRLLNLSIGEFLREYELGYLGNVMLTYQLIQRMDPELIDIVHYETAISDKVRAPFACSYDYMADVQALPALLAQTQQMAPSKHGLHRMKPLAMLSL